MSDGRTIAIGDIHGCATALATLISALDLQADDTVVMLGDAIDRGPDSRGVLQQLLALGQRCRLISILGNHEQMLLDAIDGNMPLQDWLMYGGAQTLDSYGKQASLAAVPAEHVALLRGWGDFFETDTHFFVHGNYLPDLPLGQQPFYELRWRSLREFTPARHRSGRIAIMGHTSNKQGQIVNLGHLICIDTYCHGGGWLTALEPATGHVWQASQRGKTQTGDLPPKRTALGKR